MQLTDFYSRRIYRSKSGQWNLTTDYIYKHFENSAIDPYIALSIYYLESYYRPSWFTIAENLLSRSGLLKNPSIGPFQIRQSYLKTGTNSHILTNSLKYITILIEKSGLHKHVDKSNFVYFGRLYNHDRIYGEVLYKLWTDLKKAPWKIT